MLKAFRVVPFVVALAGCEEDKTVRIDAGDSARLEAVAADSKYAGYRIVLAAGTYHTTKALDLQKGQSIVGQQQYRDTDGDGVWDPIDGKDPGDPTASFVTGGATILDASGRSDANAVVLHSGNSIERVTVRGKGRMAETSNDLTMQLFTINIQDPWPTAEAARVTDCVIEAGAHGIAGGPSTGTREVILEGNIVRDNDEQVGIGTGNANGATAKVTLTHNRLASGNLGLISLATSSESSHVQLTTTGNVIDGNTGMGVFLVSGFSIGGFQPTDPNTPPSNHNRIDWTSKGDRIWRNGSAMMGSNGGVLLEGALDLNFTNSNSSNNQVNADLTGTVFANPDAPLSAQNQQANPMGGTDTYRVDLVALGGAFPLCGGSGNGNVVNVTLHDARSDNDASGFTCFNDTCSSVLVIDNLNQDTATNKATLQPAADAFVSANHGLNTPWVTGSVQPMCGTM